MSTHFLSSATCIIICSMETPCNVVVPFLEVIEQNYKGVLVIMWPLLYCLCGV